MANGSSNGGTRVPTWFAVIIALSGIILGAAGGSGTAMLKVSQDFVTKAQYERELSALEHRAERSRDRLNDAIIKLEYQVTALTESLVETNTLLARLDERMCDDERPR